VRGTILI